MLKSLFQTLKLSLGDIGGYYNLKTCLEIRPEGTLLLMKEIMRNKVIIMHRIKALIDSALEIILEINYSIIMDLIMSTSHILLALMQTLNLGFKGRKNHYRRSRISIKIMSQRKNIVLK
jgi:hypothetical protein